MDLRPTLTATNVGTQKDKHEVLKIDDDDLYDLDASTVLIPATWISHRRPLYSPTMQRVSNVYARTTDGG